MNLLLISGYFQRFQSFRLMSYFRKQSFQKNYNKYNKFNWRWVRFWSTFSFRKRWRSLTPRINKTMLTLGLFLKCSSTSTNPNLNPLSRNFKGSDSFIVISWRSVSSNFWKENSHTKIREASMREFSNF